MAQAASIQVLEDGQEVASRAAQHGAELFVVARSASLSQVEPFLSQLEEMQNQTHSDLNGAAMSNSEMPSSMPNVAKVNDEPTFTTNNVNADDYQATQQQLNGEEERLQSVVTTPEATEASVGESDSQDERIAEGSAVPATRAGRAVGFASLGLGLAVGTVAEAASRVFGTGTNPGGSVVANDANADRLAATLRRMRGAALKMGQMLSIQDESLLPPALTRALEQVRQGAEAMPKHQLYQQLQSQLGEGWRDKFVSFDELPFAAASIGQVHRAKIVTKGNEEKDVALKVQYPGVANSIESDLRNLTMLVKMTGFAPKGLFIDNVIRVGRDELKVECDYIREMNSQKRFKDLVESDPFLKGERFVVPAVVEDLTSEQVLASEFAPGGTIEKVLQLSQEERNRIGKAIFHLTMQELFVWRFMQTDPNWGNFLYDMGTGTTYLIDFGAAREYSKDFVDGYLRIVWANANRDERTLMSMSHKMNFLTGEENNLMLEAHKLSGYTLGEPFASYEPFDFRGSNISSRLSEHSSTFLRHRLT